MRRPAYTFYWWLFVWCCANSALSAQDIDTTVWVQELSIAEQLIGTDADSVDMSSPTSAMNSLSDILRSEGQVYFRNYGPGSSSTVSMFGSRSNEVALIWNGIKIANPMLGVNDYSMISPAALTSLRIARMGTSTIYGAGSGSGAILLGQEITPADHPMEVTAGWSSLGQLHSHATYTQSKGTWRSRTSLGGQISKNNFPYTTLSGDVKRLPHARSQYLDASHHSEIHKWANQTLSLSVWGRHHFREIPPTLTESRSEADQTDQFLRSLIQYESIRPSHKLHLRAYYGHQKQIYQNPLIRLKATHVFENAQLRMDNQWQLGPNWYTKYGAQMNLFQSRSDNYLGSKHQYRFSAYSQIKYRFSSIPVELIMLIQPEWLSDEEPGWTTEMKVKYAHAKMGRWSMFLNQTMVSPTLNDLYWDPGGNPDLIPEQNRRLGAEWRNKWNSTFRHHISTYYKWGSNWIQWVPTDLGFWRPMNAREGKSYGAILEIYKNIGTHVELKAGYQYVRTLILDEAYARKQTIYSPQHMSSIRASYESGSWRFQLSGEYTSTRYVTRDHNQSLDPYFLCHADVTYTFRNEIIVLALQVKNILNTDYQNIINRPMPGRHGQINLRIKI